MIFFVDKKKLLGLAALVIVILALEARFGFSAQIRSGRFMAWMQGEIQAKPYLGAVYYLLFTAIGSSLLALPGITFALLAGIIFGPVWGSVLCIIGTALGASLAFLLARYFFKDAIKARVLKNPYLKKFLFDESERYGIKLLMITRLIPLFPFNLQNYAYGITDMKFCTYTVFSTLFIIPGTIVYTIGGAGLLAKEDQLLYLLIFSVLLVLLVTFGQYLQKKYLKQ